MRQVLLTLELEAFLIQLHLATSEAWHLQSKKWVQHGLAQPGLIARSQGPAADGHAKAV